ncbi:O-antigen ligase family protein [Candidatus Caldatribacterium saccharofermentans]|uniref:O-antigen ligase family protein n=1 Tax=Candidatus Caldatribacterium saccharofermentans TaxID=1454753 RepID=UPI003D01256D
MPAKSKKSGGSLEKTKKAKQAPSWLPFLENTVFWFLFALVLLAPYYRGLYFRLERYPFFLFICGAGIFLSFIRLYFRTPFVLPKDLTLVFTLFVLLYGVNVFFAADRGLSYQEFVNWGVYALLFFLVASLKTPLPRAVFLLFGGNTVLLTLLGLFQAFRWIPPYTYILGMPLQGMFEGGRLHSTLQYPNTASAYLGAGYLALLGITLEEGKTEGLNFLASFLAFLALAGTFFTYSRGGLLLLALMLLFLLLFFPQKIRAGLFSGILATALPFFVLLPLLERFLRALQPLPFWGILLVGAFASASFRGLLEPLERRLKIWPAKRFLAFIGVLFATVAFLFVLAVHLGLVGGGATRLLDVSLRTRNVWERLIFYRDGLRIFALRPVSGWGGGGWEALYLSVRSFPYFTRSTHNFYLQVLVEGGLVGMTLLVLLLFFLFRMSSNAFRRNPTPWVGMLFGILVFGFLHGFVDVDFNLGAYQLGVWFLAGCLVQGLLKESKKEAILPSFFLGVAFLLFFILSFLPVPSERFKTLGDSFVQEKKWDEAVYFLERASRFEPWNPEIHYALSRALRQKFLLERKEALRQWAIEEGEKALRLALRNASILEHVGILYAERGDFDRALPLLKKAVESNPFELSHYLNLARVCRYAGRFFLEKGEKEKAIVFLEEGIAVEELLRKAEGRSLVPLKWDTGEVRQLIEEMKTLKQKAGE